MKTILLCAAAMGFTVSIAAAECAGHSKVSASVDTETKVASVANQTPATGSQTTVATEEVKAD